MQLDINQLALDLVGWAIAGAAGFAVQWAFRLRKDIDAAHRKIREITSRIDLCQTHRE